METYLDMGNQSIYNVKEPVNLDQAVNKRYVDGKVANKVNTSYVQNIARQVLYKADKVELNNYLKLDGSSTMTGNLQMNKPRIKMFTNINTSNR